MKKQIELQRDEMGRKHYGFIPGSPSAKIVHLTAFCIAFDAGVKAAEPIIRADERERILGFLRSKEATKAPKKLDRLFFAGDWADWLSEKLKELDNAK